MKAGATLMRGGAKKAWTNVGKWVGVGHDDNHHTNMQTMYLKRKAMMARGYKGKSSMKTPFGRTRDTDRALQQHSDSEDDTDAEAEYELQLSKGDKVYTRDVKRGIALYRAARDEERTKQRKPGWFGGVDNKDAEGEDDGYRTKKSAPERKHSNIRDDTLVALQLESMPTYYPYFTYSITTIQVLLMLGTVAYAYTIQPTNEIAKFALIGKPAPCSENPDVSCPINFEGVTDTTFEVSAEVNWSFGPNSDFLMMLGAKWSGCMRYSGEAKLEAAKVRQGYSNSSFINQCVVGGTTAEPGYPCDDSDATGEVNRGVACCESFKGLKGMMTFQECKESLIRSVNATAMDIDSNQRTQEEYQQIHIDNFPAKVDRSSYEPTTSVYWEEGDFCREGENIVLRPCCGIRMKSENFCELLTETQCLVRGGVYNDDKTLCSDVMCFGQICKVLDKIADAVDSAGTKFGIETDPENRNQPIDKSGNFQWWRFILPLFLHSGVISCVLIMVVQVYTGRNIEVQAGFFRTFLIYFISGIGGNAISATFSPKTVSMGADPAAYGFLGVELVELFQAWQVIPNAWWQLTKLLLITAVLMLLGTLPYIDNWSHVGGFAFGVVSGVIFLPYITFGKRDARRKRILIYICTVLLFFMFLMSLLTFYLIGNSEFCTWCKYLNCIPYTDALDCSNQF